MLLLFLEFLNNFIWLGLKQQGAERVWDLFDNNIGVRCDFGNIEYFRVAGAAESWQVLKLLLILRADDDLAGEEFAEGGVFH